MSTIMQCQFTEAAFDSIAADRGHRSDSDETNGCHTLTVKTDTLGQCFFKEVTQGAWNGARAGARVGAQAGVGIGIVAGIAVGGIAGVTVGGVIGGVIGGFVGNLVGAAAGAVVGGGVGAVAGAVAGFVLGVFRGLGHCKSYYFTPGYNERFGKKICKITWSEPKINALGGVTTLHKGHTAELTNSDLAILKERHGFKEGAFTQNQ